MANPSKIDSKGGVPPANSGEAAPVKKADKKAESPKPPNLQEVAVKSCAAYRADLQLLNRIVNRTGVKAPSTWKGTLGNLFSYLEGRLKGDDRKQAQTTQLSRQACEENLKRGATLPSELAGSIQGSERLLTSSAVESDVSPLFTDDVYLK